MDFLLKVSWRFLTINLSGEEEHENSDDGIQRNEIKDSQFELFV